MIDAGNMAAVLLEHSVAKPVLSVLSKCLTGRITQTVSCLIALHDIGKCHPYFQMKTDDMELLKPLFGRGLLYDNELSPPAFRHEKESERLLKELLKNVLKQNRAILYFSKISALHHQPLSSTHTELLNTRRYSSWAEVQQTMIHHVCEIFLPDWQVFDTCSNFDACCTAVWGLMMLADWLASSQEAFRIPEEASLHLYSQQSRLAAETALLDAGLSDGTRLPNKGIYSLFSEIPAKQARPVQEACESLRIAWADKHDFPLMTLIEAPMGEGKTEAAVSLAAALMEGWQKTGIYFALPTAATSNCMYDRISKCLYEQGISGSRLIHGHAWLLENAGLSPQASEAAQSWLAPMRRSMIAPYGVGTVDQAMMAVLRIRYTVIRLLGLTGKVLIVDEVHAYDAYMQQTLYSLLAWAKTLDIPVVLLSATLPSQKRAKLFAAAGYKELDAASNAYPLITCGFEDGRVEMTPVPATYMNQTVRLECRSWMDDPGTVALFALEKAASGGCIGVIVNTVGEAQRLYREIEKSNDAQLPVYLFHARFPMYRRLEIEKGCVGLFGKTGLRPGKAILIATQVVEQSIDLDLDFLITALCPVDLLLQRIGRMHRHMRVRPAGFEQPGVLVLTPEKETDIGQLPSGFVYAPWILKKTWQNIRQLDFIHLPEDIRTLVEQTYSASSQTDEDFKDWARMTFRDATMQERARSFTFPRPRERSFFMHEEDSLFPGEEDSGMFVRGASTRFDDGNTAQIVFVSDDEFQQFGSFSLAQEKDLMRRSASVPRHWLRDAGLKQTPGQGKLRGIQLLMSQGNLCRGTNWHLVMDEKLGFIKEEGNGL